MKKIIIFCVTDIIASILFSSCGSNMSITKRHYNNGYYITYNEGKPNGVTPKKDENGPQSASTEALYSSKDQTKEYVNEKSAFPKEVKVNNVASTDYSKVNRKIISRKGTNHALKRITNIFKIPELNSKQDLIEKNKLNKSSSERDQLSLFWIVILAILIFWAVFFSIGFLLEGLINLLLVVALILLILWLLRIL